MEFDIVVKIKKDKITDKDKEQKIKNFQKTFVNAASRYYTEKKSHRKKNQ